MHAKTGTAEVYGKQTTSWFATYTKDYSIVMTISQGGTGSGASAPAVRKLYNALYGVSEDGKINKKNALLPTPQKSLPKIESDGSIDSPKLGTYPPKKTEKDAEEGGTQTVATGPLTAGPVVGPAARPVSFDGPPAIVGTRGGSGNRAARRRTGRGRAPEGRGAVPPRGAAAGRDRPRRRRRRPATAYLGTLGRALTRRTSP
jgi:penicillin-binding protein 2